MFHVACKVEFQSFNRSYSQLTFFNFYNILSFDLTAGAFYKMYSQLTFSIFIKK